MSNWNELTLAEGRGTPVWVNLDFATDFMPNDMKEGGATRISFTYRVGVEALVVTELMGVLIEMVGGGRKIAN